MKNNSQCKNFNTKRVSKRYYEIKARNLQELKHKCTQFKELERTYIEIDKRSKLLEEMAVNKCLFNLFWLTEHDFYVFSCAYYNLGC